MSTTRPAPATPHSTAAPPPAPWIRDATEADLPAIQAIYAHHVLTGVASFEEIPPSVDDLRTRLASVRSHGLPYMVAEIDGKVAGYCYATPYRPRAAYRNTIEDSIYVSDAYRGRGLGRVLLQALIERCETGPWRQMVAVIADGGSGGSLSLHAQLGFELAGTLKAVGFKHGRWLDTTLMQRTLGVGDSSVPDDVAAGRR
ncbi:L-methionine sulfoximine/L-methionine sulfone acetyltransferase [Paraburkholderia domus]|jgi:Sortase and related acyltransferases|uniref:L-methionine sulfoximine/L-methionine sulfone acetyltransferase n=1 Tax=Paraburkholderia domus TaxID=2793075 RepID=A0A9N8MP76_9BURK|nr:GNAT family N-acetyltransferase [Paraburkholderia domus]MBK5051550.1 N-acetyltransferase [Burkholderia sp. R-70006]MBK5089618.1 N-acetyltransferase [Burkholderia sp. R-69927]MBK5122917.1 N-acetyltransferase [Burkholderia sp. R-69980]MBK5165215.1 N-acetyltransferase [Burkholderia sp. R-70211]MBK5182671.1 N-acetyltransferase [Burkholderia sp. R-69749]MCI0148925.1 GNAT family N-acetyltransferase [Paraburkholderia sediminicola]